MFNTLTYQWIAIEILTAKSLPVTFTLNVYKEGCNLITDCSLTFL